MAFFANYDYKKLEKFNKHFLWVVIGLLIILQFTPLGITINGAKRWINLGFMQLQPSEFAKPLFCMLLATLFKVCVVVDPDLDLIVTSTFEV